MQDDTDLQIEGAIAIAVCLGNCQSLRPKYAIQALGGYGYITSSALKKSNGM